MKQDRVLFITPTSNAQGAKDYFSRALAQQDYYVRDVQEQRGAWNGLGAELLDLSGEVQPDDFFRLCDNVNPVTGKKLTPRTKEGRRIFYDFTFDAPKAVTLALELGSDERILDAFGEAVRETMGEMEADMHARVRSGGADSDRRTANMLWAEFVHRTARPVGGVPDPQLHCHAIAFNATYDTVEDRWKAAQFGNLVRDKLYYQAAFHSRFAEQLQALGYDVRRDGTSFTLAGIDRATVMKFSRRSMVIAAAEQRLGITDPKAKSELGRRTREAKPKDSATLGELRNVWQARLTDAERDALQRACGHAGDNARPDAAEAAVAHAVDHCLGHKHELPERRLMAEALMQGVGRASVSEVWGTAPHPALLRRHTGGQTLVSTRDARRDALAVAAFVRDGRGQHRRLGGVRPHVLEPALSDEQRRVANRLLGSRDRVLCLSGTDAGRAQMTPAMVKAIEAGGRRVFFSSAAEVASDAAGLGISSEASQSLRGQVLWIEQAQDVRLRDMKRLVELARQQDCRVVLSAAPASRGAAGKSDPLRLLQREAGMAVVQLSGTRGQAHAPERTASLPVIPKPPEATPEGGVRRLVSMRRTLRVQQEWRRQSPPQKVTWAQRMRQGESRHVRP